MFRARNQSAGTGLNERCTFRPTKMSPCLLDTTAVLLLLVLLLRASSTEGQSQCQHCAGRPCSSICATWRCTNCPAGGNYNYDDDYGYNSPSPPPAPQACPLVSQQTCTPVASCYCSGQYRKTQHRTSSGTCYACTPPATACPDFRQQTCTQDSACFCNSG